MSNQESGRRQSNSPVVPHVSPQTWKELLEAAGAFHRLAPWKWMHDSQIVGLRHPVTGEVWLGSILGRMRTLFALLVYRNSAGHRWLLNTILNDGETGEFSETAFEQDAIKAEFVLKRELQEEDKSALSVAGYAPTPKSGRVWPQFRSFVPGAFPWHVTQAEAETLLFALPRVGCAARLALEDPELWQQHTEGDIAFVPAGFDPAKDTLRSGDLEWEPMLPPPAPAPEDVSLDEEKMAQLLELEQRRGFHLELDAAHSSLIVLADTDRPRFPMHAMAVDRSTGFVGGFHLGDLEDREGAAALGIVLFNAMTQLGARPETIRVQRPLVGSMIAKIPRKLGVPVVQDAELESLNMAKASLEEHLGRR